MTILLDGLALEPVGSGCHNSEERVGMRSVGVEHDLTASELVAVELADVSLFDRLGQQQLGLADSLPLVLSAEAVVGQSIPSDDGLLGVGFGCCSVHVGHGGTISSRTDSRRGRPTERFLLDRWLL
ncbi:hypothetical protein [Streptomyces sp. NBC_00005]|uniref:hypothetical protein n=1 Tax=Streptomyces sp. NBC_00005 TaxID=2903609 RepID=UPI0032477020